MKRKHVCLAGLTIVLIVTIGLLSLLMGILQPVTGEKWEVVVDLIIPGVSYFENASVVSITFSEEPKFDPIDKLNDILGGNYRQCRARSLIENTFENGKWRYYFTLYGRANEILTRHNIPPIRQDNVGERFCFYAAHGTYPVGNTSWWDKNYGSLTVILPVGYEIENVSTSAPEWEHVFTENRWRVRASWREGKFDKFNVGLYLEIHYRKV